MKRNQAARSRVREWRHREGLSIEAAALQLEYKSHAPLARWELGDRALPVIRLLLLEKLTGIDALELCDAHQRHQIKALREAGL